MSDGSYLDILLVAMVAAFIAFRLRGVLGRKTGGERPRPSPLSAPPTVVDARAEPGAPRQEGATAVSLDPAVADPNDPGLKAGVTEVRLADPQFDLRTFLEGARAAFTMVVEAYGKGQRDVLKGLLAGDVYRRFVAAMDEREAAGLVLTTEVVSIEAAELAEAGMRGTHARLAVRFVSEQVNATRDAEGTVVEGDLAGTDRVVDLWTFERDTRARDPNWLVVETFTPEA